MSSIKKRALTLGVAAAQLLSSVSLTTLLGSGSAFADTTVPSGTVTAVSLPAPTIATENEGDQTINTATITVTKDNIGSLKFSEAQGTEGDNPNYRAPGYYYLVTVEAPASYEANTANIMINNEAVANCPFDRIEDGKKYFDLYGLVTYDLLYNNLANGGFSESLYIDWDSTKAGYEQRVKLVFNYSGADLAALTFEKAGAVAEHDHACADADYVNYAEVEATCTTDGIAAARRCKICGDYSAKLADGTADQTKPAASTAAFGHDYVYTYAWTPQPDEAYTCAVTRTCKNNNAHTDTDSEAKVTKNKTPATCTTDGEIVYRAYSEIFKDKGEVKYVTLTATGHDYGDVEYKWSDDYTTCTATTVCGNDKTHVVTETVNAKVTTIDATCTAEGSAVYTATFTNEGNDSGKTFERKTETVTIAKSDHIPVIEGTGVEATCTTEGKEPNTKCSMCDLKLSDGAVIPKKPHTEVSAENGTPATCVADGKESDTKCSVCQTNLTEGAVIPKLGHLYGEPTYNWTGFTSCTASISCTRTGCDSAAKTETVTLTDADCQKHEPSCGKPGAYIYTATFADPDFSTKTEVDPKSALTHTEEVQPGEWSSDYSTCTAKIKCSNCDEVLYTETVSSTTEVVEPTCTIKGVKIYTAVFENANFGTKTGTEFIDALGHSYGEITYEWNTADVTNVTCTATRSCTRDGCTETQTETATATTTFPEGFSCEAEAELTYTAIFTNTAFAQQTKTITAGAAHTLGAPTIVNEATCEDEGLQTAVCSVCHQTISTVIPASGHTYAGAWTEETPATCSAVGTEKNTCSTCHHEVTREIPKLPHTPVDDAAVAPTCTETGLTAGTHCDVCGEVITAQEDIPANGHDVVVDEAEEPTCTETGLTEGSHCDVCGEIIVEQETVPVLDHTLVTIPGYPASCLAAGLNDEIYCEVCNTVIQRATPIAPTGHTVVDIPAVEPTCTTSGFTAGTKCDVCGITIQAPVYVPAIGHSYIEANDATPATCTTTGKTASKVCANCGDKIEGTVIPAKGHNYVEADDATPATCTKAGKTASKICTNCGDKIEGKEIPAKGHSYGAAAYTWSSDNTACTASKTCSVCKTAVTEKGTVTKAVTAATYFAAGKTVYTAKFTKSGFTTQTKTVAIAKKVLGKVTGLKVSAQTDTTITLKWTKVAGATGYVVEKSTGSSWSTAATISKGATVTAKISGLKASTTTKFRVKAMVTSGSNKAYGAVSATVSGVTKPSKVTGVKVSASTDTTVTLKWTKNTSAAGYRVQQYVNGSWSNVKNITSASTVTAKVTGLKAGTQYKFRIVAYKGKLDAAASAQVSVYTNPSKVTGLKASAKTKSSVTLKWDKNTSATGYVVEQYVNGKWQTVKTITKNSTVTCKVTGLKANTKYTFRVTAIKKVGTTTYTGASVKLSVTTAKK